MIARCVIMLNKSPSVHTCVNRLIGHLKIPRVGYISHLKAAKCYNLFESKRFVVVKGLYLGFNRPRSIA